YVPLVSDELKVIITVEAIETAAYQKKMEDMTKKAAH
ncbi:MAG: polyisoprenoid-binding protein, partial [Pseudomonadales bacterium]|nr:polyisoprenoid-binding protein [Pseudomonadales bacterium]